MCCVLKTQLYNQAMIKLAALLLFCTFLASCGPESVGLVSTKSMNSHIKEVEGSFKKALKNQKSIAEVEKALVHELLIQARESKNENMLDRVLGLKHKVSAILASVSELLQVKWSLIPEPPFGLSDIIAMVKTLLMGSSPLLAVLALAQKKKITRVVSAGIGYAKSTTLDDISNNPDFKVKT